MSVVDCTNPHQFCYDPSTDVCYRTLDFMGYPGYRVGDDGNVQTCRKRGGGLGSGKASFRMSNDWVSMKSDVGRKGHRRTWLYCNQKCTRVLVHHLVLLAFFGPCPVGLECCHWDDVSSNNCIINLRWGTRKDNTDDRTRNGKTFRGAQISRAKLNDTKVVAIRERYATGGIKQSELAAMYGVSQTKISSVIRRKTWKHV